MGLRSLQRSAVRATYGKEAREILRKIRDRRRETTHRFRMSLLSRALKKHPITARKAGKNWPAVPNRRWLSPYRGPVA